MKARLVRIGNSRGVRLPKPVIEDARLSEDLEIRVIDGAVVITSVVRPRSGCADAARTARDRGDDRPPDETPSTRFDDEEWRWE